MFRNKTISFDSPKRTFYTRQMGEAKTSAYVNHQRIGGTIACVLTHGEHFGKTPHSEWLILTGQTQAEDLSRKFPVQLGVTTEALNALFFTYRSGLGVDRSSHARGLHTHRDHNFLVCQPDGFVIDGKGEKCLFEAKHSNHFSSLDEQIKRYYPQLQHNMYVTNTHSAFLSVILGTQEPNYVEIQRADDWLKNEYLPAAKTFWQCVKTQTPPDAGKPLTQPEIKIEGRLTIDASHPSHNQWMSAEAQWLENKEGAESFKDAKEQLKTLAPPTMQVCIGERLELHRNRKGHARIVERSGE